MKRLLTSMIAMFWLSACGPEEGGGEKLTHESGTSMAGLSTVIEPTIVTFYSDAGFSGTEWSVTLSPVGPEEVTRLVTQPELQAENLFDQVSSIRLSCGSRDSKIVLFTRHNTSSSLADWSTAGTNDQGVSFLCEAGLVREVDLHTEASGFADRVASAYVLAHAVNTVEVPFSTLVADEWNTRFAASLPPEASADGGVELRMTSSNTFYLRQKLTIDRWPCEKRGAVVELSASFNADLDFSAQVASTHVDAGRGDALGCRSKMEKELATATAQGAQELADSLDEFVTLVGNHPRHYFHPLQNLNDFALSGGGTPDPEVVILDEAELTP